MQEPSKLTQVCRADVLRIIKKCRVRHSKELCSNQALDLVDDEYLGVSNEFLGEIYQALTGVPVIVVGIVEDLHSCPCCGYKTLSERFDPEEGTGFEICRNCNWEDNGTTDPGSFQSLNHGSIGEYRARLKIQHLSKWKRESSLEEELR